VSAYTAHRAPGGSTMTALSGTCTRMRRCLSAGCGRCCCSHCTRWPWPASPSTPTIEATRGDGYSAPAHSLRRPLSVAPPMPNVPSTTSDESTPTCTASRPTADRMRRRIRTYWNGFTSPRWTASCSPIRGTVPRRSIKPGGTATWPTWPWWPQHSECLSRPAPKGNCTTALTPTAPNCGERRPPATLPGFCC
jgi:hypothetical protein